MVILLELALVLVVIGFAVSFFVRGKRTGERQDLIERRVEAYMLTIRREAKHPNLVAMTDPELRDVLLSGARNLRLQAERKWYFLLGCGVAAFIGAVLVATQDGTRGFGVALLVGAVVIYGLNEVLARRMREPLLAQGIDVERLRVE